MLFILPDEIRCMTVEIDRAKRKNYFVKNALKNEYKNRVKEGEQKQKAQDAAAGLRKINGRVYRLEATHTSRSKADADASARGSFTSIQRVPDGWGVFVLTSESPGWLERIRAATTRRNNDDEEEEDGKPAET